MIADIQQLDMKGVFATANFFSMLTPEELELLIRNTLEVRFGKGEMICKQGLMPAHAVFLVQGLVKLYIEDNSYKQRILYIIKPGHFIGIFSNFSSRAYHFSASAIEPTVVYMIDKATFHKLAQDNREFAHFMLTYISNSGGYLVTRLILLQQKQMRGRIADVLLFLATDVYKAYEFRLPITRKELSQLVGFSQENVIRTMGDFDKEGLIQVSNKNIKILQPEELTKVSEQG